MPPNPGSKPTHLTDPFAAVPRGHSGAGRSRLAQHKVDAEHAGVMVDREGAKDRDDAFWVEPADQDGAPGWLLHVHIASVTGRIRKGTPSDLEALRRGASRYLPDRTIPMLPRPIQNAASLGARIPSRTLHITLTIAGRGDVTSTRIQPGHLDHAAAMDYPDAADTIGNPRSPHGQAVAEMLTHAHQLARVLLTNRRGRGALVGYDLTAGWAIDEDGRPIHLAKAERNAGYLIVTEFMIATNAAVAAWAAQRDVPILFRNHRAAQVEPPRDELLQDVDLATHSGATVNGSNAARGRLDLLMRPATYEPHAGGHHALALAAYTHATSPLRRYPDLINQRILLAAATDRPAPYTFEELTTIADRLTSQARERREARTERFKSADTERSLNHLAAGELETLDSTAFHRVLKAATRQGPPPETLTEEITRRCSIGTIAVADAHVVLFEPPSPDAWTAARDAIIGWLTTTPTHAVSLLAMRAQVTGDPAPTYPGSSTGAAHCPAFTVTAHTPVGDTLRTGPARTAATKKAAGHQAALGLICLLVGIPDASRDLAAPAPPPETG